MKQRTIYGLLLILTGFFLYLSITTNSNILEGVFSITASGSLFSMIFKYFLDESKQLNDHYLNSNIVHDIYLKLTEFGNEYIEKIYETLDFLMQQGQNPDILKYAHELYCIRRKYIIYLDNDIIKKLEGFEGELKYIGANTKYLNHIEIGDKRNEIIEKLSSKFLIIINQDVKNEDKISSIDDIINNIKTKINATKLIEKRNDLI